MSGDEKQANGAGAATVLAAALGCCAIGVFALAGDASERAARVFDVWVPSGPLSGVAGAAIAVWLVSWYVLARSWRGRNVNLAGINAVSALLFLAALLLTFPPFMDLLQGK